LQRLAAGPLQVVEYFVPVELEQQFQMVINVSKVELEQQVQMVIKVSKEVQVQTEI
jgi:hypothetical protein